jgi:predicted enzyme related to lactoylglutathione lyase
MGELRTRLSGPVIDCDDDAIRMAQFYATILGWQIADQGPLGHWAVIKSPDGRHKIEFQGLSDYQRPVWPNAGDDQQMMMHLDIAVEDIDAAVVWAVGLGATIADHQPRPGSHRVMLDPAGHPFCLFRGTIEL